MAMFIMFATMIATSLVGLPAILDLPLDPPLLCGCWNQWQVIEAACDGSLSLG